MNAGLYARRRYFARRCAAEMAVTSFLCLLSLHTFAQRPRRLISEGLGASRIEQLGRPSLADVQTYLQGDYKIDIVANPGARSTLANDRLVLLLGFGSEAASVSENRTGINPKTGRRFDVVIGLAGDHELERTVLDHLNRHCVMTHSLFEQRQLPAEGMRTIIPERPAVSTSSNASSSLGAVTDLSH